MGISKEIISSGLVVLSILCCQFFTVFINADQTIQHKVPVELTGTLS